MSTSIIPKFQSSCSDKPDQQGESLNLERVQGIQLTQCSHSSKLATVPRPILQDASQTFLRAPDGHGRLYGFDACDPCRSWSIVQEIGKIKETYLALMLSREPRGTFLDLRQYCGKGSMP